MWAKLVIVTFLLVMTMGGCSCSSDSDNVRIAIENGRNDALKVVNAPAGSMQQEGELLRIQSRKEKILQLGDTVAANAYVATVEEVLDSCGIKVK